MEESKSMATHREAGEGVVVLTEKLKGVCTYRYR
jgi:hypothetical protein